MKCCNKPILLFIMIFIFITMCIGCSGSNPIIPGIIDTNPTVNPDNSTVSYVVVSAASSSVKVGESVQIVVKGYNSDDEWVILDKAKIKFWTWSVQGCYNCFEDYVDLNPKSGSLTTTFSSTKAGTFFIGTRYQESTGDFDKYTEVKVTK